MKTQLTDVRGVGPSTARALGALGIRTVAALAEASAKKVAALPGFGEARAAGVIAAAGAMLKVSGAPKPATSKPATSKPAPRATNAAAPVLDEKEAVDAAAPLQGEDQATKKLETKGEKESKKKKKKDKKQKKKGKKKKNKKKKKK